MDSISDNLRRAQEAIARARLLSSQLSSLCLQPGSSQASTSEPRSSEGSEQSAVALVLHPSEPQQPVEEEPTRSCHDHVEDRSIELETSGRDDFSGLAASVSSLADPVRVVAQQLASLQRKQSETLQQLLVLRLQQLK